MLNFEAIYKLS